MSYILSWWERKQDIWERKSKIVSDMPKTEKELLEIMLPEGAYSHVISYKKLEEGHV